MMKFAMPVSSSIEGKMKPLAVPGLRSDRANIRASQDRTPVGTTESRSGGFFENESKQR
jgi:hypothetical protein